MTDQFDCNSSARSDNRAESKVKGLDACEMTLEELLAPEDEQSRDLIFAVPVYQRHYKWGKTECKKLIEDVLDITKLTDKTHYFGSILVTKDRDSQAHNELTLIDGQQRLVTLGLLLAALRNAYNESDEEYKWLSKILEVGGKTRIKPYVERAGIFNEIVLEKKRPEDSDASQMAVNYHIFEEEVNKNKEEILRGIKCLGFVLVELDPEMAQQVFSSINMTGVRLSNADLIHNFVLTGLGRQDQENIERLWRDIENNCQDVTATNKEQKDYLEDFWYYYLLFYLGKREKDIKRGGYELFENFRKTFENKMKPDDSHPRCEIIKGLCLEWREYSEYFNKFLNPTQISSQEVRRHICYLKRFNNKAVLSLLLGVYKDFSNDVISEREMVDVLILLESLFVRRSLVFREKWPSSITTVYHKIINTSAYKQIKSNPSGGIDDRYSKKIASRLNGAFPRISVLDNALGKVNFYESSITGHILERINDLLIQERVNCTTSCNIKTDPDYSAITIEHIFPQDPKADWSPATGFTSWGQLDKQVQREYKDRLNRLGNLTLLTGSDNSSVKNKPFSEKLQTYKGSEYLMTNDMCEYPEWTCDNIDLRDADLIKKFKDIWKHPSGADPENRRINIMFMDDYNPGGQQAIQTKQRYDSVEIETGNATETKVVTKIADKCNMKELFTAVVKYLWNKDKNKCLQWSESYFWTEDVAIITKQKYQGRVELGDGFYLSTNAFPRYYLDPTQDILQAFDLEDNCFVLLSSECEIS